MTVHAATYLTGYVLLFCTLLSLLLVIPAASAASNKLKPGWRAWVWPLAFLGLLVKNSTETAALSDKLDGTSLVWQIGDLAVCFSLTMLVLNSVHRTLDDSGATRFSLIAWLLYFLFAIAITWLGFLPGLLIYETLCTIGLTVFYAMLYLQQRNRAPDAPLVMAGVVLLLVGAIFRSLSFNFLVGPLVLDQLILAHLIEIGAIYFLLRGATNSYSVKYAAQRRRERNEPALDREM